VITVISSRQADPNDSRQDADQKPRPKVTLTIKPERKKPEDISYEFKKKEIVIQNTDKLFVEIEILKGGEHDENPDAYIAGYCATETLLSELKATSYRDANQVDHPVRLQSDGQLERFPIGTIGITFNLNLSPRKMVLIGIIVAVRRDKETTYTDYLCDPQVGNGPPEQDKNLAFGPLIPL